MPEPFSMALIGGLIKVIGPKVILAKKAGSAIKGASVIVKGKGLGAVGGKAAATAKAKGISAAAHETVNTLVGVGTVAGIGGTALALKETVDRSRQKNQSKVAEKINTASRKA